MKKLLIILLWCFVNLNAMSVDIQKDVIYNIADSLVIKYKNHQWPNQEFVNSYIVRAFNILDKKKYTNISKEWVDKQIALQQQMKPKGMYYMGYHRKPGEDSGDVFVADDATIAMAILSTALITKNAKQKEKYIDSVEEFVELVLQKYRRKTGGITDGIWTKSKEEWWCSTALFSQLLYKLYSITHKTEYLIYANNAIDWLLEFEYYSSTTPKFTLKGGGCFDSYVL